MKPTVTPNPDKPAAAVLKTSSEEPTDSGSDREEPGSRDPRGDGKAIGGK